MTDDKERGGVSFDLEKWLSEHKTTIHGALGEPCDYVRVSDIRGEIASALGQSLTISELTERFYALKQEHVRLLREPRAGWSVPATGSAWIAVEERLPEDRQEVWFFARREPSIYPGRYLFDHWSDKGAFHRFQNPPLAYWCDDVTAWIPLVYPPLPAPASGKAGESR